MSSIMVWIIESPPILNIKMKSLKETIPTKMQTPMKITNMLLIDIIHIRNFKIIPYVMIHIWVKIT